MTISPEFSANGSPTRLTSVAHVAGLRLLLIAALATVLCPPSFAGFKVSKKVYRMDQLEDARTKAKEDGEPVTFMLSDENTSCGLCAGSSLMMMDKLGKKTVMVYVDSKKDFRKLPRLVQQALAQPEAGSYIPRSVVFDADISEVIAIVPYASGSGQEKIIKTALKTIKDAMPDQATTRRPLGSTFRRRLPDLPADESREMRTWTSRSGSQVTASLVSEKDNNLVLRKEDGGKLTILLSKLSEDDQKYVAELKEAATEGE